MSSTAIFITASTFPIFLGPNISPVTVNYPSKSKVSPVKASVVSNRSAIPAESTYANKAIPAESTYVNKTLVRGEDGKLSLKDYFEQSTELITQSDGGPPRWFSPLECGFRLENSPLLLYLPGADGVGLGLILHHKRLGKFFDIWCLHIPVADRTSFPDLVKLVENTVHLEYSRKPNRPIYLVGDSFGGCLALAVAALNPDIDLILILTNPATPYNKPQLQLQALIPLSTLIPEQLRLGLPYMLTLLTGGPSKIVVSAMERRVPVQDMIKELSQSSASMSSYLSVLSDVFTSENLLWKLNMLKSAAAFTNSRLHAVKAQTLLLISGQDQLLPSKEEGERLHKVLQNCEIRTFDASSHALLLEDGINLVSILTATNFYRRGASHNYVTDYLPPSSSEVEEIFEAHKWIDVATSPVMLSTLESGEIVRGLSGIPSQGPVLYVGYHMMLGFDLIPLVSHFLKERNILLRGVAHPMAFTKSRQRKMPDLPFYDIMKSMGAVPVSAANFYGLFSSNSHILLYPGGMREALHLKGEEYKLFWPERSEFVRMAARFGAKIVPFGSVGEDDVGQLFLDYDDLMKIPYFKFSIEEFTDEIVKLRGDAVGEVANQNFHLPILTPKIPGRFYYLFGKPIETQGRKQELRSREKADELYLEVKSEVENCLAYLREKREGDPYRSIFPRLTYHTANGFDSEVPTFDF